MTAASATRTRDLRVRGMQELPSPEQILAELPLPDAGAELVAAARTAVTDILDAHDDRLLVVVGPCSVHDPQAALEYATRLAALAIELREDLHVVMRVYFEKPRTNIGWKGLINDPGMDDSYDIPRGLRLARRVLLDVLATGVPVGCEFLETTSPQYIADTVSYGAIGARTVESQVHRQLASGMSMPIGFKNGSDGDVQVAIDGCIAAGVEQTFLGVDSRGRSAVVQTAGNADAHVILRGGRDGPNYDMPALIKALEALADHGQRRRLVIDASHGNSGKDHVRQAEVAGEIAAQIAAGEHGIAGVMLESFLIAGRQEPAPSGLVYGQSVTDACMSWETTTAVLRDLAGAVRLRREVRAAR